MYDRVSASTRPQRLLETAPNTPATHLPNSAAALPHSFARIPSVEAARPGPVIQRLHLPDGTDTHPLPAFGKSIRDLLRARNYQQVLDIIEFLAAAQAADKSGQVVEALRAIDAQLDIALISRGRNRSEMYAAMSAIREIEGQSIEDFATKRYGERGPAGLNLLGTLGEEFRPLAHDIGLMSGGNLPKFVDWVQRQRQRGDPWEMLEFYRQNVARRVTAYRSLKIEPEKLEHVPPEGFQSEVLRHDPSKVTEPASTSGLKDRPLADIVRHRMVPALNRSAKTEDMLQSVSLDPDISASVANTAAYVGNRPAAKVVRIPLDLSELDVIDPDVMKPKYETELPRTIRVTQPHGEYEDRPFSGKVESFVPLTIFPSEVRKHEVLDPKTIPKAKLDVAAEERAHEDNRLLMTIENELLSGNPSVIALARGLEAPQSVNRLLTIVASRGYAAMKTLIAIFERRAHYPFIDVTILLAAIMQRERNESIEEERILVEQSPELWKLVAARLKRRIPVENRPDVRPSTSQQPKVNAKATSGLSSFLAKQRAEMKKE